MNATPPRHIHELRLLRQHLERLSRENNDLQISLETVTSHADAVQRDCLAEIGNLRQHVGALTREKMDLEIALETITSHSDDFERQLIFSQNVLEREVAKRTRELEEKNLLLSQEIKERQRAEINLRLAATVFAASNEAIMITDPQAKIVRVNQSFTRLTGYTPEEAIGRKTSLLKSGTHESLFYKHMWESLHAVGYWSGEILNRRKNQNSFPGWLSISAVTTAEGLVTHYIGILADNTNQKLSEAHIYNLSHYDSLTTLANRVLFQERLQQAIKRATRTGRWLALLFIDLDNFKEVNDVYGHTEGDYLLKQVASRLKECSQDNDEAIARLSGDEFVFMLADCPPEIHALQAASDAAEQILDSFKRPVMLAGDELFFSASIGIALFPQDGGNVADLLKSAEAAGYDAKSRGRNQYQFFTHAMNNAAHKRLTLQNSLRRALEREELQLYYQPQWDCRLKTIVGVEALLRWEHPSLGPISPAEFIPLAEEHGLIIPIGSWVLEKACLQNKAWQEAGKHPIHMAVNLSPRQFYHQDLIGTVRRVLEKTGLATRYLELEITESAAMSYADKTIKTFLALKELGISIAIDDFGTGYSSLGYLKQFCIDVLKIDASFIADLSTPRDAALVSAIINMAHNLDLTVIAEGIETQAQLDFLEQQNCDQVQGFLLYHPMSAEKMTTLLTAL